MIIQLKVIPQAKRQRVVQQSDQGYKVYLTAPALEGKANKALIALLAAHFHVRKQQVEIIKGLKSRQKTINILADF